MSNGFFSIEQPKNEPVKAYLPASAERASLKAELARQASQVVEIPLVIGGRDVKTGTLGKIVTPHDHRHQLASFHNAGEAELKAVVKAAKDAKAAWADMPFEHRAAIFLKAADLLAGPWRDRVNAATMLGQS